MAQNCFAHKFNLHVMLIFVGPRLMLYQGEHMTIPGRRNFRGPPAILRTPRALPDQSRARGTLQVPLALVMYRWLKEAQGKAF